MSDRNFFFGTKETIDQAKLAQFKRETAKMELRGELSASELRKRAIIIRKYEN